MNVVGGRVPGPGLGGFTLGGGFSWYAIPYELYIPFERGAISDNTQENEPAWLVVAEMGYIGWLLTPVLTRLDL